MEVKLTAPERWIRNFLQHYNHEKYWNKREILVDPARGTKIGDLFRLLYIKRQDAFNNATMGTHRNFGAQFASPPHFPHGIYGIVISHNAVIGKNAWIYHQVTIGEGRGGAPRIGDDVMIGAGSKLIGNIKIVDHVRIGAGCVVMTDVPDHAVVLPPEPVIKIKRENNHEA